MRQLGEYEAASVSVSPVRPTDPSRSIIYRHRNLLIAAMLVLVAVFYGGMQIGKAQGRAQGKAIYSCPTAKIQAQTYQKIQADLRDLPLLLRPDPGVRTRAADELARVVLEECQ